MPEARTDSETAKKAQALREAVPVRTVIPMEHGWRAAPWKNTSASPTAKKKKAL